MGSAGGIVEVVLAVAVFAVPTAMAWWLAHLQAVRERNQRTIALYLHFESDSMKRDRGLCWDYLEARGDAVGELGDAVPTSSGHVLEFRACYSVLTFFKVVADLTERRQLDRALAATVFEPPRANFSAHFAAMRQAHEDAAARARAAGTARSDRDRRYDGLLATLATPLPGGR